MKEYLQDNSKTTEPVPASIGIDDMGVQNLIIGTTVGYQLVPARQHRVVPVSYTHLVIYPALRIWSSTTLRRPRERSL